MSNLSLVGYQRVSTATQTLDLQRRALLEAGVTETNICEDVISGASRVADRRPGLAAALERCSDATLVV
jgi:DNA invertase Pin-like site-specific DNA recombinase